MSPLTSQNEIFRSKNSTQYDLLLCLLLFLHSYVDRLFVKLLHFYFRDL